MFPSRLTTVSPPLPQANHKPRTTSSHGYTPCIHRRRPQDLHPARYIPLPATLRTHKLTVPENNPQVLSRLCENLGVSGLSFHDVLSTSPDLLAGIPRPIHALILLCDQPIYRAARQTVEPTIAQYEGYGPEEPVLWMRQTIGHACGLMALLHCLFNLDEGRHITPGSPLHHLLQRAIPLAPADRADLLYHSKFLEEAHMEAASMGDSPAPSPQQENHHHFIALVQKDGQVWELNGGMNGPLRRGTLDGEDLLSEKGLSRSIRDFLDYAATSGMCEMSIVAVAGPDGRN
ncbi:Ubiquitin carboxyl-terminal hydrolase [Penicillium capsulatum]|uniref:Ubiquitin carboxyl-terminal hydrolase n=1 Tax=Penicillium capsulatum TaxID=69766 RepID=A0A9W9LMJ6_9EURO|nr:Ubiquitin carboxyl-terminal hydrolase [Penicillium capsulatum]KAJ6117704.1 Ubiquitin carboxyl-terminal hydrolase [Penicillium capsulatum]